MLYDRFGTFKTRFGGFFAVVVGTCVFTVHTHLPHKRSLAFLHADVGEEVGRLWVDSGVVGTSGGAVAYGGGDGATVNAAGV